MALLFIDEEMKTQRKVMLSESLGSERMENFPCPWSTGLYFSLKKHCGHTTKFDELTLT